MCNNPLEKLNINVMKKIKVPFCSLWHLTSVCKYDVFYDNLKSQAHDCKDYKICVCCMRSAQMDLRHVSHAK